MERLDDLEINNYQIYQDTDNFCFGIDAVLLANFCLNCSNLNKNDNIKVADLCSGTLPIPLIMYAKRKCNMSITAFEIDKFQIELSNKSLNINEKIDEYIKKDIKIIECDLKNIFLDKKRYVDLYNTFDIITCNPPYIKIDGGEKNIAENMSISKHEVLINFDDIVRAASLLIKSNKKLYFVHRSSRITEIIHTLRKYKIEAKKIQFIYPSINKKSNLVLIEAVKCGNVGVEILEPIIIYNEDGSLNDKILKIYGK